MDKVESNERNRLCEKRNEIRTWVRELSWIRREAVGLWYICNKNVIPISLQNAESVIMCMHDFSLFRPLDVV